MRSLNITPLDGVARAVERGGPVHQAKSVRGRRALAGRPRSALASLDAAPVSVSEPPGAWAAKGSIHRSRAKMADHRSPALCWHQAIAPPSVATSSMSGCLVGFASGYVDDESDAIRFPVPAGGI
jgi:hypothetical protein